MSSKTMMRGIIDTVAKFIRYHNKQPQYLYLSERAANMLEEELRRASLQDEIQVKPGGEIAGLKILSVSERQGASRIIGPGWGGFDQRLTVFEPLNTPVGMAGPKDAVSFTENRRPDHYGGSDNPYEAIKVIEAHHLNFNLGNVVKYVLRCGKKDNADEIEDLEKARTYLGFEIARRQRNV